MNFAAIDFETANTERDSVCSMGIAVVEGGRIVKTAHWLIKPPKLYFSPYNVTIHGITEDDVRDKPEFNQLWNEIFPYLKGQVIVAHNASFDLSVLRYILDRYNITYPELDYCCSVSISKKTWTELPSYKLNAVAKHIGHEFRHHDALEDAVAAAKIVIEACQLNEIVELKELCEKCSVKIGRIFPGGYQPPTDSKKSKASKSYGVKAKDIKTGKASFDINHPCYGKSFVFTGTLASMSRKAAMQKVVDNGGSCLDMVYKDTDYLVVGKQDPTKLKDGEKSVKLKLAEMYIQRKYHIHVISEEDFLNML